MAKPRIYLDACCFIEIAKGKFGMPQTPERQREVEVCRLLLTAARDDKLQIVTSTITIAEAVHIGDGKVTQDVKSYFERLLLSGRDGVITVEPDPFVVELARDLSWDHGIGKGVADRIHVASAIRSDCTELVTFDGRLAKKLGQTKIQNVRLCAASETASLPDGYDPRGTLFHGAG